MNKQQAILSHIVSLTNPKKSSPFCVDGRSGKRHTDSGEEISTPYPQTLGGTLNSVINFLILNDRLAENEEREDIFLSEAKKIFGMLRENNFGVGLHGGEHASPERKTSDCGFADNLKKIIIYLQKRANEIWSILIQYAPELKEKEKIWKEIVSSAQEVELTKIPDGETIIETLKKEEGVAFQMLEGSHKELFALVNLKKGTTLDIDNNQKTPAFNLDLWRVEEESQILNIDKEKANLLSLGLYVSTEIALVEDKGKKRLPIIINK